MKILLAVKMMASNSSRYGVEEWAMAFLQSPSEELSYSKPPKAITCVGPREGSIFGKLSTAKWLSNELLTMSNVHGKIVSLF